MINTTLAEKERLQENLDNKIRKPKYDPYAEEFDADTGQKKMLSKYDEEIQGKKGKTFVIGQEETKASSKRNIPQISKNLTEISLEYDRPMEIVSDYVDPSTIKIKKPKKKKMNITRIKQTLDDEAESIADVQEAMPLALPTIKRIYDQDSGFGDDDELQEILAQQRRQNLKKRKISRPEDIVQSIRQHADEEEDVIVEGGLVIDDTSEFVRNLEMAHQEARQDRQIAVEEMMDVIEPEDVEMPNQDEISASEANERITNTGLEEEPLIAGSVAATLAALRRQGTPFPIQFNKR